MEDNRTTFFVRPNLPAVKFKSAGVYCTYGHGGQPYPFSWVISTIVVLSKYSKQRSAGGDVVKTGTVVVGVSGARLIAGYNRFKWYITPLFFVYKGQK